MDCYWSSDIGYHKDFYSSKMFKECIRGDCNNRPEKVFIVLTVFENIFSIFMHVKCADCYKNNSVLFHKYNIIIAI